MSESTPPARQPLLHDATVVLRAPTQVWSRPDGAIGDGEIDGVFHGDTRFLRSVELSVSGAVIEHVATVAESASTVRFVGLARDLDDDDADPKLVLERTRTVEAGRMRESLAVTSHLAEPRRVRLSVRVRPEFATMHAIKAGEADHPEWRAVATGTGVRLESGVAAAEIAADGAIDTAEDGAVIAWELAVDARGRAAATWEVRLYDPAMVVSDARSPRRLSIAAPPGADPRVERWAAVALDDLDALRLTLPGRPEEEFYAAGAPWFLTLFGRDSLWAARLSLAADPSIAIGTLRALARLQGRADDVDAAEEPGKILHELRASTFEVPGEDVSLPPAYYGTVDATALWVCLLGDVVHAGVAAPDLLDLRPALRGALDWLLAHGDAFLSYLDRSGHGLANQGWKDSGDSIQWRDGTLAEGPIALCEVQGYAYEAALAGAALLDAWGDAGGEAVRGWATRLRTRFRERFWVSTPEGRYPAVALDARGRGVDTLTSNIGHLLGTGILDADEERTIADLLVGPSMCSGFGVRTMSTEAGGYWPLSYHGGSVWVHDSAIVARGMLRAGLLDHARTVVSGMLAAAEGFAYRMPELHAGYPGGTGRSPVPYPAACRPQAWSAAAAVTAIEVLRTPPPSS